MDREIMKEKLRVGNCTVVFTKSDGTERTMLCTLQESAIPVDARPKVQGTKQSDQALAVWDLEKQGWRSFRIDSVVSFV